ncbi:MAG: ABC transporter substrate-binding protein, partial [Bacteroidota bacterium]
AADFVYSFKRLADAKLKSPLFSTIAGKIQGLDAWRKKYAKLSVTDYREEIVGLQALDKYTLQIKLVQPWPQMLYDLAYSWFSAVPREAVEHYGKDFLNHPVGTGPFILKEYNPHGNKLVYHRNPTFRAKYFPGEAAEPYKYMLVNAGKRLPFVEKIVGHIITEGQPAWLMFQKGALDYIGIPKAMIIDAVTADNKPTPTLQAKKIQLRHASEIDVFYVAFNHDNPLFKNNLRLRQALSLAYDRQEFNQLFFNNRASVAQSIIPPGVEGYQADYQNPWNEYDPQKARRLLAAAGYPEGKGLPVLVLDLANTNLQKQVGAHFQKCMAKIGVRVKVVVSSGPQLSRKINTRSTMLHMMGFTSYPEGLPFLKLLYGPASSPGFNSANFNDAEYNALYEQ